jgi:hypothetical protein
VLVPEIRDMAGGLNPQHLGSPPPTGLPVRQFRHLTDAIDVAHSTALLSMARPAGLSVVPGITGMTNDKVGPLVTEGRRQPGAVDQGSGIGCQVANRKLVRSVHMTFDAEVAGVAGGATGWNRNGFSRRLDGAAVAFENKRRIAMRLRNGKRLDPLRGESGRGGEGDVTG